MNTTIAKFDVEAALDQVLWANGTVVAQDACYFECVNPRAFHVTDLTSLMPQGVPVQISLELRYDAFPGADQLGGGFAAWVNAADATYYSYRDDWEPGYMTANILILPGGAVEAVMGAFGPGEQVTESPYTLRITIEVHPSLVPARVPVGVQLGPGSSIAALAAGKNTPFLLYSPTDLLLGKFTAAHQLPDDAPRGQYLALLPEGSAPANFSIDAAVRLTPMHLRPEFGAAGALPSTGSYEASWEVASTPLAVGVVARSVEGPAGTYPMTSTGFRMSVRGPNEFSLATDQICSLCLSFGGNWFEWDSAIGDERLAPGTYNVRAETTTTHGLEIMPVAFFAKREA